MKPKMSKRYINYEEPIFERKVQRHIDIAPRKYNSKELSKLIFSSIIGAIPRTLAFLSICLPILIFCEAILDKYHILGIIVIIISCYYIAIGLFRWIDNRVTSWRIDYYLRRHDFSKIWTTPSLYNYVKSYYRDEFTFTERGDLPEYNVMYVNGFPSNNIPLRRFQRNTSTVSHEIFQMTVRFIMGFLWVDDIQKEYFSETIYEVLWNIAYLLVFMVIIFLELDYALISDALPNGARIFLGCYVIIQFATSLRLLDRIGTYIRYKQENDQNIVTIFRSNNKDLFDFISKYKFWNGLPTIRHSLQENEIGISMRSFGMAAHTRFLLNVIKIFTLI